MFGLRPKSDIDSKHVNLYLLNCNLLDENHWNSVVLRMDIVKELLKF